MKRLLRPKAVWALLAAGVVVAPASVAAEEAGQWLDPWDRQAVVSEYLAEFERVEPDAGFTGDVGACQAGSTSQDFRDSQLQRINWFRRMSGLSSVTENAGFSANAQHAALIMAAHGELSHYPPETWDCYSARGATAAGNSNLHLTTSGGRISPSGLNSVNSYMRDSGSNNKAVGHRTWILSPYVRVVGMGDVISGSQSDGSHYSNAMNVIEGVNWTREPVREGRGFVTWPPPGYVPAEAVWKRWSFTVVTGAGDFSGASVEVTGPEGPVALEVIHRGVGSANSLPSEGIVWEPEVVGGRAHPEPTDGDVCYAVTVSGVRVDGVLEAPYEYETCVLDLSLTEQEPTPEPPDDDGSDDTSEITPEAAQSCSQHHGFGAAPVDIAKTEDLSEVLAQAQWGYNAQIGICYLVLDEGALAILRGHSGEIPDTPGSRGDQASAERCSQHHGFGAAPVDVAKTDDLSKVLAQVYWQFNSQTGICNLVLDDLAVDLLRSEADLQESPGSQQPSETSDAPSAELAERISRVTSLAPASSEVCLSAYQGDRLVVAEREEEPLVPASLMKIVTAVAAREVMGSEATYITRVVIPPDAQIDDGTY